MCVTVQTASDRAVNLLSLNLKEDHHEYKFECRCRTLTGACGTDIDFDGTEIFKLFRGCVSDRRGYLGTDAPWHHLKGGLNDQGPAVMEWFFV